MIPPDRQENNPVSARGYFFVVFSVFRWLLTKTVPEDIILENDAVKITEREWKDMKMVFKNMEKGKTFTLRNQDRELMDFGKEEIEEFLDDLFVTPDQFIVLSAPKALGQQIRFVQACIHDGEEDVETELGIEEEDGTHLYFKMCTDEECARIFMDFFDGKLVVDRHEYEPVPF